jgi:hypothetical protein
MVISYYFITMQFFTPSITVGHDFDSKQTLLSCIDPNNGGIDINKFLATADLSLMKHNKEPSLLLDRVILLLAQDFGMNTTILRMERQCSHHRRRRGVPNVWHVVTTRGNWKLLNQPNHFLVFVLCSKSSS